MRRSITFRRLVTRVVLQFALTLLIVGIALGCIYAASFGCHFVWALCSETRVGRAEDAPLWLIPMAFTVGGFLFWIIARFFRLFERLFVVIKRYDP